MDKDSEVSLPSYTFYRRNCHSSHGNYLCYLASTTEIKVISFSGEAKIKSSSSIIIPQEPVKGIRIIVTSEQVYYVAVAFVSRFMVFENDKTSYEHTLSLNCNVVEFKNGFLGVQRYRNRQKEESQMGFIFATKSGDLTLFDPADKNKILKTPRKLPNASYESMGVLFPFVYLTTHDGFVTANIIIQQNEHYEVIGSEDTTTKLPLLQVAVCQETEEVFCGSCTGQIFIFCKDLTKTTIISLHHSLISRLMVSGKKLYSFGEDTVMHTFHLLGDRKIEVQNSQYMQKLPSLMFSLQCGDFMTLYESPAMLSI